MERKDFVNLKKEDFIFNNNENLILIIKSSFLNISKINDNDEFICLEYFSRKKEYKIKISDYNKWEILKNDLDSNNLNQNLLNKILFKKIEILETKLKKISKIL